MNAARHKHKYLILMGLYVVCIVSILISVITLPAHAKIWNLLTVGPDEGELYFSVTSDSVFHLVLVHTDDYAQTFSLPLGFAGSCGVDAHPQSNSIWVHSLGEDTTFYKTTSGVDSLQNTGISSEPLYSAWNLMPDSDSLVFLYSIYWWSFDTLRTTYIAERNGLEGTHAIDYCAGWQNGQHLYVCDTNSDTTVVLVSDDYSNNYALVSWSLDIPSEDMRGWVFPGYAPGELYLVSFYTQNLYVSTDWGATWTLTNRFMQHSVNNDWVLNLYPGWGPGQMVLLWYGPYYYGIPNSFEILFTSDYGETWEYWHNPSSVPDQTEPELPPTIVLDAWPNPTNGQISICIHGGSTGLSLFNQLGRQVRWLPAQANTIFTLDLQDLPTGSYYVTGESVQTRQVLLIR